MAGRPGYVTVPILSVLASIGYVYYTAVFLAIPAWLGLATAAGVANAVAFTALAAACVATYAVAVSRDPGRVPSAFLPDVEDAESPIHEIKRKGGDLRYCQKCSHYKPPRAHHCRVCKRCVLRMVLTCTNSVEFNDHHCIWINNCVGHENYKIFLVFVLYAVIASLYSLVLVIGGAVHSLPKNEQLGSDSSRTSIYHEGVRAMWLAEKAGNLYHHPYDLGVYENLVSVLGPNVLCWLCPISRSTGNGIRFRTSYDIPLSTPPI
uniref:S-acyltransferase n=1 Tax=Oryza meridionalis TaxID=40149 RepID=A0A0E0CA74_9ORYZ